MYIINNISCLANAKKNNSCTDIIAIDGGSKRNTTDISGAKALHTLNAYSNNYGMCVDLGVSRIIKKEIPAAKELLEIIDIKDTIVTLDALNTQKSTVEAVIKNKSNCVGALKGNHGNLFNDVKDYFEDEELIDSLKQNKECYVVTKEKQHSSIVSREYFLTSNIKWLSCKKEWKGIKSIGLEKKTIKKNNGTIINESKRQKISV